MRTNLGYNQVVGEKRLVFQKMEGGSYPSLDALPAMGSLSGRCEVVPEGGTIDEILKSLQQSYTDVAQAGHDFRKAAKRRDLFS